MKLFKDKKKATVVLIGVLLGLVAGFAYWKFVGCQSGTCPLTAKWQTSTLFGGIFGYLIADSIKLKDNALKEKTDD